jgi:hypothetical protein
MAERESSSKGRGIGKGDRPGHKESLGQRGVNGGLRWVDLEEVALEAEGLQLGQ